MKRILAILLAVLVAFAAAGCTTANYSDWRFGPALITPQGSVSTLKEANGQNAPADQITSCKSPPERPLNLVQCIDIALTNNPGIAQKKSDIKTALAEEDIARGKLWPKIGAIGSYVYYREDRLIKPRRPGGQSVLGFTDELLSGDVVLRMPLYTGGRLRNEIKAAEFASESARHRLVHNRLELVFNVSSVFYSMLAQREVINSLTYSRKSLQEHEKKVSDLLAAHKAAKVDLLRTKVRLAAIEQQLLRERNVLNVQHFLLASLMGLDRQNRGMQVEGKLKPVEFAAELDEALVRAFGNRHDYHSLQCAVKAQQRNVKIAEAGHLPEVSLQASYGNRWAMDGDDSNEIGQVGAFLEIPIFEGGRIAAKIRRERSRLRNQKEALRELRLQIQLEVETAISDLESTWARVGVTEKAVEQAKESLRIEREKYSFAKGAIIDVLDAQSALVESQTNYYRALADYNIALAQFRLAIGETP